VEDPEADRGDDSDDTSITQLGRDANMVYFNSTLEVNALYLRLQIKSQGEARAQPAINAQPGKLGAWTAWPRYSPLALTLTSVVMRLTPWPASYPSCC